MTKVKVVNKKDMRCKLSQWLIVFILMAITIIVLVIYYHYDPRQNVLFPQCIFHNLTGLQCPSCGNQRALYALLHGDFLTAARYNLLFFVTVPYGMALLTTSLFRSQRAQRIRNRLLSWRMVKAYMTIYLIWGLVRNLTDINDILF